MGTITQIPGVPHLINAKLPVVWDDIDPAFWWIAHRASGWQHGESGMLQSIVSALGISGGTVIECGAGDGISLPLTCQTLLIEGWNGILIEGNKLNSERLTGRLGSLGVSSASIVCKTIAPDTFDDIVCENTDKHIDLLILDIDSIEYQILEKMRMRPSIVCVEHHDMADAPHDDALVGPDDFGKVNARCFLNQTSFAKTRELMESIGYTCVGKTRINGLFVTNDLAEVLADSKHNPGKWPCPVKPKCVLVLSQPRLGFTAHSVAVANMTAKLGFTVINGAGAFWDRDMEIVTRQAIQQFMPDYLVYSDYDSVFATEDVETLLSAINADPDMGAIGCVQMSRHDERPLVFDSEVNYKNDDGTLADITRVRYQHFGLTIIRRQVFESIPCPWFWTVPNLDGSWTEFDRSDADITFWRTLISHGIKVCQHNKVVIGHIIQSVKMPGPKGTRLIPIEYYERKGKPPDCVFNPDLYMPKPTPPAESKPPEPKTE